MSTIETIYHHRMLLNSAAVAERRAASGDYPQKLHQVPPDVFHESPRDQYVETYAAWMAATLTPVCVSRGDAHSRRGRQLPPPAPEA